MKNKVIVENLRFPVSCRDGEVICEAKKRLDTAGISYSADSLHIYRKSVDARHKDKITLVCSVTADTEETFTNKENIRIKESFRPEVKRGSEPLSARPVIVGFGPAGIFCASALARGGLRPLVLERGGDVDSRVNAINRFYETGELDTETNIQFGAGGAGTFSDGKLTTRIGDYRCDYVLEMLRALGAPEDIMWKAKPHIGTDILRQVIKNAAGVIRELGGEIRFNTKVTAVGDGFVDTSDGRIAAGCVVLATGHSARDTYKMLIERGFSVEAKPFSVGVRAEHLQSEIDRAMYGREELAQKLGHAEYQLSYRRGERGVYSFCMCPGGEVVAASSEEFGVVTNGMSRHARDGKNANAAIAVSVLPGDYGGDPMGAVEFQRSLETAAFNAGGKDYSAPCQLLGDYLSGQKSKAFGRVSPTYMNGRVSMCDLNGILPGFVSEMLKAGFQRFGKVIKGFDRPDTVLCGIETRTSAPMRILRNERLCALCHDRVYPCGEGAGYAGGIMSAAVDGLRVAEAVLERFSDNIKNI